MLIWTHQEKRKVPSLAATGNVQVEEVSQVYITGKMVIYLNGKLYCHADMENPLLLIIADQKI